MPQVQANPYVTCYRMKCSRQYNMQKMVITLVSASSIMTRLEQEEVIWHAVASQQVWSGQDDIPDDSIVISAGSISFWSVHGPFIAWLIEVRLIHKDQ